MMKSTMRAALLVCAAIATTAPGAAAPQGGVGVPQRDRAADERRGAAADRWAATTEAAMTDDERFSLIHGFMALRIPGLGDPDAVWPDDVVPGAGYVPGIPRLGVPSLRETDASLGVTNPFGIRKGDTATALPAGLALGATFNPALAYRSGKLVGREARARGFNVLLGGGINLTRDPRNGRNFEYISEDPLLSGIMGGAAIRGTQDVGVIGTAKHFALNSNETNRHSWNAVIDEAALRESDLLAFQIAIEQGHPGSIMCAYNLVGGAKACGNDFLLNTVLKQDWGYKGWVMSDWGAVSGADFATKGLDQQSGDQLDKQIWFDGPLKAKLADGSFDHARLSDMVRRILRSMKTVGVTDWQPQAPVDMAAHAADALEVARQGIVLLKNDDVLPLAASARSIAIIGDKAQIGVLSGGGSSQGLPPKGWSASDPIGGTGQMGSWRIARWFAGAPVDAIAKAAPHATVAFDPGLYPQSAAALAARADVAIVFVNKYAVEGFDAPDLSLPYAQDALVEAVAKANPNTIVVLETGNPVTMPWRDKVKGIVAAWYPGQEGAQAIADVLTGKVNPSGRLPITFPDAESQLVRPTIPSFGTPENTPVTVTMTEGADVGYRWYAKKNLTPMYAFGHGLSYTDFAYSNLRVRKGTDVTATVTVTNTGKREGADVPQLYLESIDGVREARLLAFDRVVLRPQESRTVTLTVDPRLLAHYRADAKQWQIAAGRYVLALARSANDVVTRSTIDLRGRTLAGSGGAAAGTAQ
jgi:beta-glucosidase